MFVDRNSAGAPPIVARGSLAVEMDWALSGAHRLGKDPIPPVLEDLYRSEPALRDDVLSLWGEAEQLSYPGYLELSILANEGGLLYTLDRDLLLDSLEALAARSPGDLVLGAETPEDRTRILARLRVLRSSPKRRKHYVDVVRRVWARLRPAWENEGLPTVEREVAARSAALLQHRPAWSELGPHECDPSTLEAAVGRLGPGGEVAVVPAWLSGKGLVLDLPGVVVVGVPVGTKGDDDRARAERLARRLKVVADPTRLAILATLGREELTVSDIAQRFSLAQPTVSNHVKLLREAGFVTVKNEGRNRRLVASSAVVDELGEELRGLLAE